MRNGLGTAHFFLPLPVGAPPPDETAPEDLDLNALLERTLPALGYELVDLELSPKGRLVRIFIDKANGVDVEDCARVSSHLTRLFAVENVDFDRLEVSSPGLDRPLKKAADYARFVGQEAKLTLREPVEGARRLKGILRGLEVMPPWSRPTPAPGRSLSAASRRRAWCRRSSGDEVT